MDDLEADRDNELKNIKIKHGTVKRENDDHFDDLDTRVDNVQDSYRSQQATIDLLTKTNQDLQDTITQQNLKLNSSNKVPQDFPRWSLVHNPDAERYPLLKSRDPKHSFGKFHTQLSGMNLRVIHLHLGKNFGIVSIPH